MIWHFFEVWVLMLAAFAVGCPIGALAYRLVGDSRLGGVQGDIADMVGDVVDGIKSRLGIGPVWRPEYRRLVERSAHENEADDHPIVPRLEAPGRFERPMSEAAVPMLTDRSGRLGGASEGDAARDDELAVVWEYEDGEATIADGASMARPMALATPRNGVPDDLQRIRGIGRRIEHRLNRLGIFHFGQIAAWTPAEVRWVGQQLAFPDRIERDGWVDQAIVLAAGGDTGFAKSADRRRARRWEATFAQSGARGADAADIGAAGDFADEDVPGEESLGETLQAALRNAPQDGGGPGWPVNAQEREVAVVEQPEAATGAVAAGQPAHAAGEAGRDAAPLDRPEVVERRDEQEAPPATAAPTGEAVARSGERVESDDTGAGVDAKPIDDPAAGDATPEGGPTSRDGTA